MRRSNGPGSARPRTTRARLGRPGRRLPAAAGNAPLLGRGRCLAYRALRRPSLRGAAAPRRPRCAGGCGPSAARFPVRLAPGVASALPVCGRPCVGWAGLAWLRPRCPRVASARLGGSPWPRLFRLRRRAWPPGPGLSAAAGLCAAGARGIIEQKFDGWEVMEWKNGSTAAAQNGCGATP